MEFVSSLMQHKFLQYALMGGIMASIGCGVVGSYVVVKRIGFLAGGIAHAVLGGMGAAFFFGVEPIHGALLAAIVVALLIGWITLNWRQQEETSIGAMWAVGMAIGILFISQTPGYQSDLMTYLFGNILLITARDLWLMAVMDVVLLVTVTLFYRQFLIVAFDEEFARLRGIPVVFFHLLLLCLVAISVVLLIRVVGLILVIALLTLPAAIAMQYVHTVGRMMALATALGVLFCTTGLAVSYQPDVPAGATIILVAGAAYLLSMLFHNYRQRIKARAAISR